MLGALERVYARLQHAVGRGGVALVDDTGPVQTIQVQCDPFTLRDKVPLLYHFGFSASPPVGSEVMHSTTNGDPMSMVVVATGHRASRPKNLQPGQSVFYDQSGTSLKLTNDHNAVIALTGTFSIAGGVIHATGTTSITLAVGGNNIILDNSGIHVHGTLTVDGGPIINNSTVVVVP